MYILLIIDDKTPLSMIQVDCRLPKDSVLVQQVCGNSTNTSY